MAYTKTNWVDRQVEFPNKYKDQNNNEYTFTRDEGTITQEGTQVNATVMQNIEDGLENVSNSGILDIAKTFIPEIGGSSNKGTTTYTLQQGRYIKIGKIVFYDFKMGFTGISGATGKIKLFNFPEIDNMIGGSTSLTNLLTFGTELFPNSETNGYTLWNGEGLLITEGSLIGAESISNFSASQHFVYGTGFYITQ